VFVLREINAAVVPRIAITASLGLDAGQGSFGSIARCMLEKGARGVGAVLASIEDGSERRHAAWFAKTI
jgi:hypothetical protein